MAIETLNRKALASWAYGDLSAKLKENVTEKDLDAVIGVVLDNIVFATVKGYRVNLGFFKVEPKFVAAKPKRKGRNPQTGEAIDVPASPALIGVRLSALKRFKDAMPSLRTSDGKKIADAYGPKQAPVAATGKGASAKKAA